MGIGSILPSVHKHGGWKGQYRRMIRWYEKLKQSNPGNFESSDIFEHHDILYACFQNIFFLKDWLIHDANLTSKAVNDFVNENLELQLCRDICNGTKHFNLNNASVEADFTIIREYNPFHKQLKEQPYNVIILSDGHKFELKKLASQCIQLWNGFITKNNLA